MATARRIRPDVLAEDSRVPFFDVTDPVFSVSSAEVHRAKENG